VPLTLETGQGHASQHLKGGGFEFYLPCDIVGSPGLSGPWAILPPFTSAHTVTGRDRLAL
jgi:hypothetical protein